MESPHKLTSEQVECFRREGYLAIEAITSQEEIQWVRGIYDRLFSERAGRTEGNQFDLGGSDEDGKEEVLPQILGPAQYAPELEDAQFRLNAKSIS